MLAAVGLLPTTVSRAARAASPRAGRPGPRCRWRLVDGHCAAGRLSTRLLEVRNSGRAREPAERTDQALPDARRPARHRHRDRPGSERRAVAAAPGPGIEVVTGRVAAPEFTHDRLNGVRLSSGWLFPCQAVVIVPRFHPAPTSPPARGLEPDEQQMGRCGRQLRASTRPGPPRYRECGWPATCPPPESARRERGRRGPRAGQNSAVTLRTCKFTVHQRAGSWPRSTNSANII